MMQPAQPSRLRRLWRWYVLSGGIAVLLIAVWSIRRDTATPPLYPFVEGPMDEVTRLGLVSGLRQSSVGTISVLVVYAQFQDEASHGEQIPADAARLFDPNLPGSFTHYYDEMSFGRLRVHGTILPKRYTSDLPSSAYLAPSSTERGKFGDFAFDILSKVDADVDLGQFDNDGPDGIPNSGDDDRIVDYVFLIVRSVPPRFLFGRADGIAGLGRNLRSSDASARGKPICILRKRYYGSILSQRPFAQTVGIMAHEFGHALGLPDLYDVSFQRQPDQDPAEDSAGIGRWGLMGRGAFGWKADGSGGPSPICAWTREQLGWVGPENRRLREVSLPASLPQLADVQDGGELIKIYLEPESPEVLPEEREYLLVEARSRTASFYNRQLPAEGALLWHVRPAAMDNLDEDYKLVDLVCADGRFADAGYPMGRVPDERHGGDNLDFWDRDGAYAAAHAGNLGDASDVFDGVGYSLYKHLPWRSPGSSWSTLDVHIERRGGALTVLLSDPSGVATAVVETAAIGAPGSARLLANYPNPFNPDTTIPYVLPAAAHVRLVIYNSVGQAIRVLTDDQRPSGRHEPVWDSRDDAGTPAASGVYHCRLEVDGVPVQIQRMTLLR